MRHITLETMCGEGENAKTIDVTYLIVEALSPYNIILGRPTINILGTVVSTLYLSLKYLLPNGRDSTVQEDQ